MKQDKKTATQPNRAQESWRNRRSRFNNRHVILGWILLVSVLLASLATAICLNLKHTDDTTTKMAYTISIDDDDDINWNNYPTREIVLGADFEISASGTYHVTGQQEGQIRVNNKNGHVRLLLENATIKNSTGPVILCSDADKLIIEILGENHIEDGEYYQEETNTDEMGVIYSKADLVFQGDGQLSITANYSDAIVGKDDLKFSGGIYSIKSKDDAIHGKDSVYVAGGTFIIDSGADAFKATNQEDKGKGYILIKKGNLKVGAGAKALKATNTILLQGGNYSLNSRDDAIHSDNYIGIADGEINISSGDDAIHADRRLAIDGGRLVISQSKEGLEAQNITINDGVLRITSEDDGINSSVSSDPSSSTSAQVARAREPEETNLLINGGEIYLNANGDGLDSNGWIYINGGLIVIDGPNDTKNAALDATIGIVMNGGKVFAIGDGAEVSTLGDTSSVLNISIYLGLAMPEKTLIEIKNKKGDIIFSHESVKSFNYVVAGSLDFMLGEEYDIYFNGKYYDSFIISGITTAISGISQHFND